MVFIQSYIYKSLYKVFLYSLHLSLYKFLDKMRLLSHLLLTPLIDLWRKCDPGYTLMFRIIHIYMLAYEKNLESIGTFIFLNIKLFRERPLAWLHILLTVTQYAVTSTKFGDRNYKSFLLKWLYGFC